MSVKLDNNRLLNQFSNFNVNVENFRKKTLVMSNNSQKVNALETLSVEKREAAKKIRDRINNTVVNSVTIFADKRAGLLREIREEKGAYNCNDIVNTSGFCYAELYSEVEKRHENSKEQLFKLDGSLLTKEDEIQWLDDLYENDVRWQISCVNIAAQREKYLGHIEEIPKKEIEQYEACFFDAKKTYMDIYKTSYRDGKEIKLNNLIFLPQTGQLDVISKILGDFC